MEQKMAPGAGLTPQQKQFLAIAIKESYILKTFYLSGGTALSSWYLHHRESYDLDFFSLQPFDYERIIRLIRQEKPGLRYISARIEEDYGFLTAYLQYPKDVFLKIDFHHYSNRKLTPGIKWHGLEIDSLFDITVNKLRTIATLPRTRDYIDFYFVMKKSPWTLDNLLINSMEKFQEPVDMLQLAKNFLKVSEYTDYPIMIVPFDINAVRNFYEQLVSTMKPNILK